MNTGYGFNSLDQYQFNNSYWNKYEQIINSMTNDQKIFVSKQKNVIQAKQNLISSFIDYLFEQQKNSFVMTNESARKLADDYIDAISKAGDNFVTRSEELEKENQELKKQIKQLMLDFGEENGKDNVSAE